MSDDQHLRKNEYEYWLCPLCDHALIYDTAPEHPYCPKMVDVHKTSSGSGIRWNHFSIGTSSDLHPGEHRYIAVIPPFYVAWYVESQHLYVHRFGPPNEDFRLFSLIQEEKPYSEEQLLKLYKRLDNLKVFA